MLKLQLTFAFILLFFISAFTQEFRLTGTLQNQDDNTTLPGATVKLTSKRDTLKINYTRSGVQGEFKFEKLTRGRYYIEVTYIGFENFKQEVLVGGNADNLGILKMKPSATTLGVFEVKGTAERAEQKGDTTQYNAAAFKVTQDATTEDLVKKMPGITIENGTVKAHGEDVKKILVDGKQFFGDDPSVTLKNLPAEVVDKIQVFDKLSDQAAWTGFDDGSGQKTINIVTKNAKNSGQFGKFSAGYGTDGRYLLGANVNLFKEQRRITLLGMSNNINQQNFSADNITGSGQQQGMGGRGGGGMPTMGAQDGIFSTNALGFNYTESWKTKLTINASYFWNNGKNNTNKVVDRQYILGGEVSQYYNEVSKSETENTNHRMNMRFEYNPDTNNSIFITPRLSIQVNNSESFMGAATAHAPVFDTTNLINETVNKNTGDANGYNFNNDFLYRHKFKKYGRTASINIGTGFSNRYRNSYVNTLSDFYGQGKGNSNDTINQYGKSYSNGINLSSNLVYTEPLGKKSQLQLNYNISWAENNNDKKTYNYEAEQQLYNVFDTLLSNIYNSDYITNRFGAGYLYQTEKTNLNAGLTYQYATLTGNTSFPYMDSTEKSFNSILPNLMFNYKFTKLTNLRVVYRASSNSPSVTQLQKVIDNSNPLLLTTGNPTLKQELRHFAMARFSHSNQDKTRNLFGMLFFQKTFDYIGNSSFTAIKDTVIYDKEINAGTRLTVPVNLDGAWNGRVLTTIGMPLKPLKSNLNLNAGLSFNRLPSLINNVTNQSNTYGINLGAVLSSNISQKLDFTFTYNVNYNLVDNSIQPELNNNYFFQIGSVSFNWEFWKGFFMQNTLTYQNYNGISSKISDQYSLWNFNLGKKIFKNKAGEIKLSCYDILNQNKSLNRSVTDTYIEDSNTEVLSQYFMLSVTYNLRKFNGKMPAQMDNRPQGFDGRPPDHMH